LHIAQSERAPLDIAELAEQEQMTVAGVAEMAVVGAALLLAEDRLSLELMSKHDGA